MVDIARQYHDNRGRKPGDPCVHCGSKLAHFGGTTRCPECYRKGEIARAARPASPCPVCGGPRTRTRGNFQFCHPCDRARKTDRERVRRGSVCVLCGCGAEPKSDFCLDCRGYDPAEYIPTPAQIREGMAAERQAREPEPAPAPPPVPYYERWRAEDAAMVEEDIRETLVSLKLSAAARRTLARRRLVKPCAGYLGFGWKAARHYRRRP